MAQALPEAIALPDPPTDGVTSLSFLPPDISDSLLVSSSWDGSVRIHDVASMKLVACQAMESGSLLSLATPKGGAIFTGGLDGSVRRFDVSKSTTSIVGFHSEGEIPSNGNSKNACSCLSPLDKVSESDSVLASSGWDSNFYLWDVRAPGKPVSTIKLPGKAFSMDSVNGNRVVVNTAGRKTCIIDVRMSDGEVTADMVLNRESSLKYQTRVVRFFPDGKGMAVGSIEGRVAIEFLDELRVNSNGMKKYAFKCHRVGDIVYPVNTISFNSRYGTFATGGCDGTVVTWDGLNKKKLTTLPKFATSIAALCFNHDGTKLAIASSYTYEEGERDHPRDEIFIREMLDSECKPKSAK
eukprot:CAMPEP_0197832596 /NCGR_PEP_ID=MMETSP1437-20131217/15296_1 /TAXON_ID=49252 ORGANISM="Eucampia antarctica, Strain CCMP1452" /NCGR_SAMPLE_ID=MMETSP1437 /ASSEMBLY_ACC=CAM_ASM_001096 /LENGTH=352 /DNA_ID=CAMNT_0043436041 /DNA_START=40 /DNA_END=1098 /DNA_ORIENTATION=+